MAGGAGRAVDTRARHTDGQTDQLAELARKHTRTNALAAPEKRTHKLLPLAGEPATTAPPSLPAADGRGDGDNDERARGCR